MSCRSSIEGSTTAFRRRPALVNISELALTELLELLEMAFTGRSLSVGDVYSVISERSPDGSKLDRIAYVDANPEHSHDIAEFAEVVARNRGVNVRLFTSLPEAKRWLRGASSP